MPLVFNLRLQQSKRSISPRDIGDGRYVALQTEHRIEFSIDDVWYEGNTEAGCRGINEPVTVTIRGDQATFAE